MFPRPKIAVVVPCHNEEAAIKALVTEIKQHVSHVIVVDDGSTDQTRQQAELAGAEVLCNETPQGKGAALRLGWKHALDAGFQFALTMDGDGQHAPADIPKFLAAIDRAPLVIGNRMTEKHKMPLVRRFVNRWMSRRLSRAAGIELADTQCGFRLVDLEAWSKLRLNTTHFEIESEVLLAFIAAGHKVEFVPIEVIYRCECSKIRPLRDTVRWFRWLRTVAQVNQQPVKDLPSERPVVPTKAASLAKNV